MVKYMMATKATHKLGDISSEKEDICRINSETEKDYIGSWVTGYGFYDVRFPKETTRELTPDEIKKYSSCVYQIGNRPLYKLDIANPQEE